MKGKDSASLYMGKDPRSGKLQHPTQWRKVARSWTRGTPTDNREGKPGRVWSDQSTSSASPALSTFLLL